MPDEDGVMGLVNCPTCNTRIYLYNQHTCPECGAQVCYYCEAEHARNHPPKENDAEVSK